MIASNQNTWETTRGKHRKFTLSLYITDKLLFVASRSLLWSQNHEYKTQDTMFEQKEYNLRKMRRMKAHISFHYKDNRFGSILISVLSLKVNEVSCDPFSLLVTVLVWCCCWETDNVESFHCSLNVQISLWCPLVCLTRVSLNTLPLRRETSRDSLWQKRHFCSVFTLVKKVMLLILFFFVDSVTSRAVKVTCKSVKSWGDSSWSSVLTVLLPFLPFFPLLLNMSPWLDSHSSSRCLFWSPLSWSSILEMPPLLCSTSTTFVLFIIIMTVIVVVVAVTLHHPLRPLLLLLQHFDSMHRLFILCASSSSSSGVQLLQTFLSSPFSSRDHHRLPRLGLIITWTFSSSFTLIGSSSTLPSCLEWIKKGNGVESVTQNGSIVIHGKDRFHVFIMIAK